MDKPGRPGRKGSGFASVLNCEIAMAVDGYIRWHDAPASSGAANEQRSESEVSDKTTQGTEAVAQLTPRQY